MEMKFLSVVSAAHAMPFAHAYAYAHTHYAFYALLRRGGAKSAKRIKSICYAMLFTVKGAVLFRCSVSGLQCRYRRLLLSESVGWCTGWQARWCSGGVV